MTQNGHRSWQEALGALVKEKGLDDSELGDISNRSLRAVTREDLLAEAAFLLSDNLVQISALEAEVERLKVAAGEVEPPDAA